jgi:hypothetical protein
MQRAAGSGVGAGGVAVHRLHDDGPTFDLFAVIDACFLVSPRFLGSTLWRRILRTAPWTDSGNCRD